MPIHIPSNVDTDSDSIVTLPSRAGPITNPPSLTTERDIQDILQREQDNAMSLLSLSPLLASLFLSYANRAAATPSPENEERKALRETIIMLLEENQRLKSETREMVRKLRAIEVSQEAFRSRVSSPKEANTTQQGNINSLREELVEIEDEYDRFMVDSNADKAALRVQVLELDAQRGELKETIVKQQTKIPKLERRDFRSPSNPTTTVTLNEHNNPGGVSAANMTTRITKAKERAEKMMIREMETAERGARNQSYKATREEAIKKVERWATSIAQREAREREKAEVGTLSPLPPLFTPTID